MGHKKVVRIDPLSLALPPGGVESHGHLDGEAYDRNRRQVLERAFKVGISHIGNIFLSPEEYTAKKNLFADYPQVFFTLGIHPCDGLQCTPACLEQIEQAFTADSRIRAVGEIGLDYHWDDCPRELQLQAFSRQMEMAKKLGKPVVIHCREAESDCLTFLEAGGFTGYPILWHCFGGDSSLARRILKNGWHISIPGPITYPANTALREAVAIIPEDRILLETDCPYLSPVPWRGATNEPAYIVFTARAVAEAKKMPVDELWLQCGVNAVRFFGLD